MSEKDYVLEESLQGIDSDRFSDNVFCIPNMGRGL
jgi:hypothetical protein